jgi:glycosyltransferase involved in cell wall biosynthesis
LFKLVTHDQLNRHVIISLTSEGKYGSALSQLGLKTFYMGLNRINLLSVFFRVRKICHLLQPDFIHAWMPHGALIALMLRLSGFRAITYWSFRASSYGRGLGTWRTRGLVLLLAAFSHFAVDQIFAVGPETKRAHQALGFKEEKISIIPNGFSNSENADIAIRAESEVFRGLIGPDRFAIASVARFHPQKDHETLLQAFSIALRDQKNLVLFLAGTGVETANLALKRIISELGLGGKVHCLGAIKSPRALFEVVDLHVLASAYGEGFPNVVAESMQLGVRNIVTQVGDSEYVLGGGGWVVPPKKPLSLAAAILDAVREEPECRTARQHLAVSRINDEFSLVKMINEYQRFYNHESMPTKRPGQNNSVNRPARKGV